MLSRRSTILFSITRSSSLVASRSRSFFVAVSVNPRWSFVLVHQYSCLNFRSSVCSVKVKSTEPKTEELTLRGVFFMKLIATHRPPICLDWRILRGRYILPAIEHLWLHYS